MGFLGFYNCSSILRRYGDHGDLVLCLLFGLPVASGPPGAQVGPGLDENGASAWVFVGESRQLFPYFWGSRTGS